MLDDLGFSERLDDIFEQFYARIFHGSQAQKTNLLTAYIRTRDEIYKVMNIKDS